MRVVDVRDFCIPSDENDYDELVAFADTMASIPQFDAVPVEVLDKIRAEIKTKYGQCNICEYFENYDYEENDISEYRSIGDINDILQIIDKYKAESEEV